MDKHERWLLEKKGKFSASVAWKLFSKGLGGEMFGVGAKTYIQDRAVDMLTVFWDSGGALEEVEAILHGRAHEYPAYAAYIQATKNDGVKYLGDEHPIFITHNDFPDEFGGTPDGAWIADDGSIPLGVEIKCPKNPLLHFERLEWKDQWDIKDKYFSCYAQIQSMLMITKAPEWHFVSYDERQILKRARTKIIVVLPDKNFQNNLEIRLRQAISEKYKMISRVIGIEVNNRSDFDQKIKGLNKT